MLLEPLIHASTRLCVLIQDREKEKKLPQLEVPILAPDICRSYYINLPSKVTQGMICAGFPLEEGKDSCTVSYITLGIWPDGF